MEKWERVVCEWAERVCEYECKGRECMTRRVLCRQQSREMCAEFFGKLIVENKKTVAVHK